MTATESRGRGMTTKKQEKTFWAIVVFQLCNLSKHIQELLRACSVVTDFFVTPWTVAYQAPLFMGLSRQEHWSGLPFPPPGKSMEAASLMKQSSGAETVKYAFFPPFL